MAINIKEEILKNGVRQVKARMQLIKSQRSYTMNMKKNGEYFNSLIQTPFYKKFTIEAGNTKSPAFTVPNNKNWVIRNVEILVKKPFKVDNNIKLKLMGIETLPDRIFNIANAFKTISSNSFTEGDHIYYWKSDFSIPLNRLVQFMFIIENPVSVPVNVMLYGVLETLI